MTPPLVVTHERLGLHKLTMSMIDCDKRQTGKYGLENLVCIVGVTGLQICKAKVQRCSGAAAPPTAFLLLVNRSSSVGGQRPPAGQR